VSVVSVTSVDPVTYICVVGYEDPVFVDEKGRVYSEENVEAYDVTGKKIAEGKLSDKVNFPQSLRALGANLLKFLLKPHPAPWAFLT